MNTGDNLNISRYINKYIFGLMKLRIQIQFVHWQTKNYAIHIATDLFISKLDKKLDDLVEIYQGKYNTRIYFDKNMKFSIQNNINIIQHIKLYIEHFNNILQFITLSHNDELINIIDDIKNIINKFLYQLSLK
jgi:hypothetical protein